MFRQCRHFLLYYFAIIIYSRCQHSDLLFWQLGEGGSWDEEYVGLNEQYIKYSVKMTQMHIFDKGILEIKVYAAE